MDDRDILQPETLLTRDMRLNVKEAEAGQPLAAYLASRFTYHDHAAWCRLIDEGRVTLNGNPAAVQHPLAVGDRIQYDASGIPEPPVDDTFAVVWEDADLLAVNKSGNLPCHPAGRYYANTLERLLLDRGVLPCVHLANRLDRETSGLVLVGLSNDVASALGDAFMRREVCKQYIAVVEGDFPAEPRTVAGWLYLARGTTVRRKRVFLPEGAAHPDDAQHVETQFRCLARRNGLSWLDVRPVTGRPHQIRATLKGIGYPVVGDKLYGVDETIYARLATDRISPLDHARLRIPRQALHAFRLSFRHPVSGAHLTFTAALPPELEAL